MIFKDVISTNQVLTNSDNNFKTVRKTDGSKAVNANKRPYKISLS